MRADLELVLLTAAYPFGNRSETFLESEIRVLAERFARIFVLPSYREAGTRRLPANAELVEMDWLNEPPRAAKRRALASREALWVLLSTRESPGGIRSYRRAWRLHLDILARNILKLRALESFVRGRQLGGAIFYDYWLENSTTALALLRRSGAIAAAVSRAHNFDLYDECWEAGPVPFQEAKARGLDAVFAVSAEGAAYLEQRVPGLRGKVRVERLGVPDPGRTCPEASAGAPPVVVSCSSLIPIKRVHLIPDVLTRLNRPVRWVHIGDGPERSCVESAASRLNPEVEWDLLGHLDNDDVLRFYEQHHVDAFLSLSISEGLPVSMMEAQSYGVPIVACEVHGIPEIVTDRTGVLCPRGATVAQVARGLEEVLEPGRFDVGSMRAFFRDRFEASVNFNRFADALIELRQDQAAAA